MARSSNSPIAYNVGSPVSYNMNSPIAYNQVKGGESADHQKLDEHEGNAAMSSFQNYY